MVESGTTRSLVISMTLSLIILLNVWGSYHWIQQNIVMVGHDASGYLGTTLEYAEFLDEYSPQTLFRAFTHHRYRPPALFMAVQPFYQTFGVNMDSAQLFNILMLAVVLLLTFWLGRQVTSIGVALFATLMVGLLPMTMAMARLFYTEIFLTAAVAFNLLALYKSQAFAVRSWSIIWGISMGIGLLVKWTMPIYVALPLLWAIWQSKRWKASTLWPISLNYRRAIIALTLALIVSLLWFSPNRELTSRFLLGDWLYSGWVLILSLLCYGLLSPTQAKTNGWIALFTAVAIASLWYLPHIDFIPRLLETDQERGQQAASILNLENHLRYLRYIYHYHFGPLAFWLIVPAALWPWLRSIVQKVAIKFPNKDSAAILWLSLASAYIILLFLAQRNARNLVPLLPNVAILIAMALWHYQTWLRMLLGAIWLTVLALQWSLFTFDSLEKVHSANEALWATVHYSVPPASKSTDPAYWIGPQILEKIRNTNEELQHLGMLVNSHQLHRGMLRYLIAVEDYKINIHALTKENSAGWLDLLASQWVLLKDGDNRNVEQSGQALLARIANQDTLFHALYDLVKIYPMPDGETVSLYHRTKGPAYPLILPDRLDETRHVAQAIDGVWSKHATLLYANNDLAVWVGIHDPGGEPLYILEEEQEADKLLSELNGTLVAVVDHQSESLQQRLAQDGYKADEIGSDFAAVAIYGRPQRPLQSIPTEAAWQDASVTKLESYVDILPGEVLPVRLEMAGALFGTTKISARLVNAEGEVIASQDRLLLEQDKFGLLVPPTTEAGAYQLAVILYEPATMENIENLQGEALTMLAEVRVG